MHCCLHFSWSLGMFCVSTYALYRIPCAAEWDWKWGYVCWGLWNRNDMEVTIVDVDLQNFGSTLISKIKSSKYEHTAALNFQENHYILVLHGNVYMNIIYVYVWQFVALGYSYFACILLETLSHFTDIFMQIWYRICPLLQEPHVPLLSRWCQNWDLHQKGISFSPLKLLWIGRWKKEEVIGCLPYFQQSQVLPI